MPNVTQPPDSDPPPPAYDDYAAAAIAYGLLVTRLPTVAALANVSAYARTTLPRPHWPLIDAVAARLGLPPA